MTYLFIYIIGYVIATIGYFAHNTYGLFENVWNEVFDSEPALTGYPESYIILQSLKFGFTSWLGIVCTIMTILFYEIVILDKYIKSKIYNESN